MPRDDIGNHAGRGRLRPNGDRPGDRQLAAAVAEGNDLSAPFGRERQSRQARAPRAVSQIPAGIVGAIAWPAAFIAIGLLAWSGSKSNDDARIVEAREEARARIIEALRDSPNASEIRCFDAMSDPLIQMPFELQQMCARIMERVQ